MTAEIELARPRTASLPEKLEYARFLATSGLLPAQYREKPGNILWAQEYAEMLNLRPMAAITGIHVIEGKPSASAALMSALVRRAGHRLRVSGDDQKAVVEIVRHDDPEFVFRSEWTIDRARKAELTGKGTWKKYPAAMLKARAVSECARDACEEALLGMHYTPEELGAEVDAEGEPIRTTVEDMRPSDPDWASKPATAHERATGQPEPAAGEPSRFEQFPPDIERGALVAMTTNFDDEGRPTGPWSHEQWMARIDEATAAGDADLLRELWKAAKAARPTDVELREHIAAQAKLVTDARKAAETGEPIDAEVVDEPLADQKQHAHMHVLWSKAGVEDREERLAVTAHLVGRDIDSSKQLRFAEAELVIERLRSFDAVGKDALFAQIDRWLGEYHAAHTAPADEPAEEQP
jgi:hypothetical protein